MTSRSDAIDKLREALDDIRPHTDPRLSSAAHDQLVHQAQTRARAALDELTKERTEAILKALKNAGVDMKCGACVEVGCTGATLAEHTCGQLKEFAELRRNLRGMGEVLDWQDMSLRDACLSLVARLEHQLSAQPKLEWREPNTAPRETSVHVVLHDGTLRTAYQLYAGMWSVEGDVVGWVPRAEIPAPHDREDTDG